MALTSLSLDRELLEKVKAIAKKKKPLRKIKTYAEAVREVLIDYINENQRELKEDSIQQPIE